jgi:hypothetical protein
MSTRAEKISTAIARTGLFLGFVGLLGAVLVGGALRVAPPADHVELQTLAPWPEWEATALWAWPGKFEAWLNHHFPLRSQIIRAHSVVRHRWLAAPSAQVVVGRDGWLFYAGDRTFADFVGRDRLTADELTRWRAVLEGRRAWLRERGIAYLFVIVPNKSTIYPEQLPRLLQAQARPGKLDQLLDDLRARGSTVPVFDLRPTLRAARQHGPAYWTADSHWNGTGLVAASDAIVRRVGELGVNVGATDATAKRAAFSLERAPRFSDCVDLLAMRGHWPIDPEVQFILKRPADLRDGVSPLTEVAPWKEAPWWKQPVTTECDSGRGRAVLLCDSFFRAGGVPLEALTKVPFMLEFRRFTSLWEWATFEQIKAIAELEKPEVVIEEWAERFLKVIPDDHPEFARARGW